MDDDALELVGGLDEWRVQLIDGSVARVRALSYSIENGFYVFSALERGIPKKNVDICWIPVALVADLSGAFPSDTTRGSLGSPGA